MRKIKNFLKGGLVFCLAVILFVAVICSVIYAFDYFSGDVGAIIGLLFIVFILGGYSNIDIS